MAITGINNSSYTSYYASNYKNTVKKTDSEKDSTNTKDGNVTTSTVELKTSRPGVTKTEQIKTGYSNVNDYSKYLQGKYHYMNTGTTSMQGVPTTVSVSSAFLQKCMNDPEKAKYLEENLAAQTQTRNTMRHEHKRKNNSLPLKGNLNIFSSLNKKRITTPCCIAVLR